MIILHAASFLYTDCVQNNIGKYSVMDCKYGCALLAGGAGSRMGGRNKAELEYDRLSFAERIEYELGSLNLPCYISAAVYEQRLPDGWKMITDCVTDSEGGYIGPIGGIYSALIRAKEDGLDGLFFVPCDAPLYSREVHCRLAEHIQLGDAAVCWRTSDGRIQVAFGWYSVDCIERMKSDIESGKYKISLFLDSIRCRTVETDPRKQDESAFININNTEDYRNLRNMMYRPDQAAGSGSSDENIRVTLEKAVTMLKKSTDMITDTEETGLLDAAGRTLAEDIKAAADQPPFPRSPLDGYAVRAADTKGASEDTPAMLDVIAEIDAGMWFDGSVGPGEAVRIMTGAPVPDGADAVIGQEDTDYGEDKVRIYVEMKPHQNYCDQGEDYRAGTVLLPDRSYIGPAEAGIISSTGRNIVKVYRQPRVLLISTGDEVVQPGNVLGPGKIYDSNLYTAGTQLRSWGCELTDALHTGDDAEALCRIIENRIGEADIVITTGGVSVGKKDIMHDVYRILGVTRTFTHIAIKPGMAMISGRYKGKHILSLSGNPYAAYVDLHLAVRPVLDALNGNDHLEMQRITAVLADDYSRRSPSRRFVRAYVQDGKAYTEGHTGGNGDIYSGHGTNALLDIPAGTGGLSAGETVSLLLI